MKSGTFNHSVSLFGVQPSPLDFPVMDGISVIMNSAKNITLSRTGKVIRSKAEGN